jgi:hypothetical protein
VPAGRWRVSLQYFSSVPLTLRAPGFRVDLPAALDGARPAQLSLANDGQYWPAGSLARPRTEEIRFTIEVDEPNWFGELAGFDARARIGELVLTRATPVRLTSLSDTCGQWIDWYASDTIP